MCFRDSDEPVIDCGQFEVSVARVRGSGSLPDAWMVLNADTATIVHRERRDPQREV